MSTVHNGITNGFSKSSEDIIRNQLLDPRFECPICLSCLKEPHLTYCGHRFCQDCIIQWLDKKGGCCPIDGVELNRETDLFPDNCTKREISQEIVKCPYHDCDKIANLLDYEHHILESHEDLVSSRKSNSSNSNSATADSPKLERESKCVTKSNEVNGEDTLWTPPYKHQYRTDETTKALIKSMFERIVVLEQKTLEQETQLNIAKEKIAELQIERVRFENNLALKVCNGTYTWNIPDMRGKIRAMCKDSSIMYYSEGFYTAYTGYKFCARINILPQQKYLSLLIHMMKGDNDHILSWPFSGKICFNLIHPTKPESCLKAVMCSRPDVEAFKRPLKPFNTRGFGYNEFILLSDLTSHFFNEDDSINLNIQINLV